MGLESLEVSEENRWSCEIFVRPRDRRGHAQDDARVSDWVRDFATELEPHARPQTYVNFEAQVERAPNATFSGASQARLASLRARYDLAGVFLQLR